MEKGLLSFSEERLWALEQAPTGSSAFVECPIHLASVVRLLGRIDLQALVESINEFVRRHEVLRSRFINVDGKPVRVIAPFEKFSIPVVALSLPIDADRHQAIREALVDKIRAPFDLAGGPLVRVHLLSLGEEEHVLAVIVHHIVFDGWSVQIMWRELVALYGACVNGQASPLPELKTNYSGYVTWLRSRLEGDRFDKLMTYWTNQLQGVPELVIPGDRQRTNHTSNRSATERFAISDEHAAGLAKLCRERGVTSGVAMAAVFNLLLHKLTGATDVAVGMPIADRNRPEFEPLAGLFLNLLVLRTDISNDPTFLEVMERVRRTFIKAYDHRDLPYGFLLGSQVSMAPLRVVFNFVVARSAAPSFPGLTAERVEVQGEPPSFADLSLHVFDRGGTLSGFVLYKVDLFSASRIREIVSLFIRLLSDVIDDPERRISKPAFVCV